MKVYSVSHRYTDSGKHEDYIVYQTLSIRNAVAICQQQHPWGKEDIVVLETELDSYRALYEKATVVTNIPNTDDEHMEVDGPVTIYSVFGWIPFVDDGIPIFQTLHYPQVVSMIQKRKRIGSELLVVKSRLDDIMEDCLHNEIWLNDNKLQNRNSVPHSAQKKKRF